MTALALTIAAAVLAAIGAVLLASDACRQRRWPWQLFAGQACWVAFGIIAGRLVLEMGT